MLPKSLEDRRFRRCLGPIIGLIAGASCGLQNPFAPGALPVWITVAGGALIGGIAGILVMVLDPLAPIVITEELSDQDVLGRPCPHCESALLYHQEREVYLCPDCRG